MRIASRLLPALLLALALTGVTVLTLHAAPESHALAKRILADTGCQGGVVVHLGCGDGRLTAALHADDRYIVQGLDADPVKVDAARRYIRQQGLYGSVSVDRLTGNRLPYAENLVNLVVAEELGSVPVEEVMRVLTPRGVLYTREGGAWTKTVKPWPDNIDEWTHHLHGADGNPVANDTVVGPPKHYQWLAEPLWLRSHDTDSSVSTVVTAGGRMFYIIDNAPISLPGDHILPDSWFLEARDAFNGVFLWRVPIEHWGWREWKDTWFTDRPDNFPVNLPKRLVASGDSVYATLGYHAPVSRLEAATGEIVRTYAGTEDTREILYLDDTLVLSVFTDGRLKVAAVNANSGKLLWESKQTFPGSSREYFPEWRRKGQGGGPPVDPALNPATDGKIACLIDGQEIVCLDFATGDERWRTKVEETETATSVGTLIVYDDVVLHADRDELLALSASTGEKLWSQPKREIGWLWFQWKDVFVIDGLVWTWSPELASHEFLQAGKTARNNWPVSLNGHDPHTGEIKRQVAAGNIYKTVHHHRCYRNKATVRYVLTSRRGTEFVDLQTGKHTVHNWVRGTCHLGMIPANGLQYAPPHPCACYINEKLNGFTALAPEIAEAYRRPPETAPRLERGPAYGAAGPEANAADWPTFRHDPLRSASADTALPAKLTEAWAVKAGSKLSPPTVVGDHVYLAAIDEHHVMAFETGGGRKLWEFAAGARVDTPPTYRKGLLLFGSADGYAYCLRAEDGALAWRFRAAPEDRRIGAFGQLESAWPVHGGILVQDDLAYFAAGRSSHLDGGIWVYALDPATGEVVHEAHLEGPETDFDSFVDNINPEQGSLTDVLQGDGSRVYMRNLIFSADLQQQTGDPDRIRPLGGLLDDSYFKRAYWRYGRGATYGVVLAHDDRSLYIVRMFDSLQCLVPENFFTPAAKGYLVAAQPRQVHSQITFTNSPSLSPLGKPLTVEAWVKADAPDGAILGRGGINHGYALVLKEGRPEFTIRVTDVPYTVRAEESVLGRWAHVAGVLTSEHKLQVWIDGRLAATANAPSLLVANPGQDMQVGADAGTGAGEYESPFAFTGIIDEVRIYHRALSGAELAEHFAQPGAAPAQDPDLVLYLSFDEGEAKDESGNGNDGIASAVERAEGKSGLALRFAASSGSEWSVRIPLRGRALVAADAASGGRMLVVAGTPDVVDPDDPFAAFEGRKGGPVRVFAADSGDPIAEYDVGSPPVFNGMAAAGGKFYLTTMDGRLVCLG